MISKARVKQAEERAREKTAGPGRWHRVELLDGAYLYEGKRYKSLEELRRGRGWTEEDHSVVVNFTEAK